MARSSSFGKYNLTPCEIVISRPVSVGLQPSTDPSLSHTSITDYCKSLVSCAQACQQILEAFLDPNSKDPVDHSLKPGD